MFNRVRYKHSFLSISFILFQRYSIEFSCSSTEISCGGYSTSISCESKCSESSGKNSITSSCSFLCRWKCQSITSITWRKYRSMGRAIEWLRFFYRWVVIQRLKIEIKDYLWMKQWLRINPVNIHENLIGSHCSIDRNSRCSTGTWSSIDTTSISSSSHRCSSW